jgi:hypothetical protein
MMITFNMNTTYNFIQIYYVTQITSDVQYKSLK